MFVGIYNNDYLKLWGDELELIDAHYGTGNTGCIVANRVSYTLDLQGPSVAVDTACSSSLVALHLACRSLRAGDCDVAIAGGVNAILTPENHVYFSQARAMAADGRCKTFDSRADGFVRGEGAGAVVLKKLSRAIADGDRIYAIVRGSAVNQDGRTNGLTAPNGLSQQRVMRRALADANITAADLGYIEAHGTGTPIGDSMELQSMSAVLADARAIAPPWIGAVKTNIGHLESAAGIAGIIKTALALSRELIPKNLHFRELNPHVTASALPLRLATEPVSWPRSTRSRLAGISSFGFGGTNSHVILEEAPVTARRTPAHRPRHLVGISAGSEAALAALAKATRRRRSRGNRRATSRTRRRSGARITRIGWRSRAARATTSRSGPLAAFADGKPAAGVRSAGKCRPHAVNRVGVMFTGQGAQAPGMGRVLFDTEPVFRAALERVAALCSPHPRAAAAAVVGDVRARRRRHASTTPRTRSPRAVRARVGALSALWSAWGLRPAWLVGHSIGEYVAATVAGAISVEDACKLVCERGRLMQALPRDGAMAVVFAPRDAVASRLGAHLDNTDIAATNSPKNTVISGRTAAIAELSARLESEGITVRAAKTSHAFHSPLMEPALDRFAAAAAAVAWSPTTIAIASNVTGELLPVGHVYDAAYWRQHLRGTVRFADGARAIVNAGAAALVELGPSPTLAVLGRDIAPDATWIATLDRKRDDWESTMDAVGALYVAGIELDADAFAQPFATGTVPLPRYPFQHAPYWMPFAKRAKKASVHPLLGRRKEGGQP